MPDNIALTIPSLHGGVSQQPPLLRHANQVQDAVNATFSVFDGASKRQGTEFVGTVVPAVDANGADGLPLRNGLHAIERDDTEQYLVVYGSGIIKVYDTDGNAATVNVTTAANTYLTTNTPTSTEMRLLSIADYTLIANTTVELATGEVVEDYDVDGSYDSYDILTSYNPAENSYWRVEEDDATGGPAYYKYLEVPAEFATWIRDTSVKSTWRRPAALWNNAGMNPMGFRVRFQRQAFARENLAYLDTPATLTKAGAFALYEFESGDEIYISGTGSDSLPEGWWEIASKTSDDVIVLTKEYRDTNDAAQTFAGATDEPDCDVTGITKAYDVSVNFNAGTDAVNSETTMYDIALSLRQALNDDGAEDALINWRYTGGNNQGMFQIIAPYRGAGTKVVGTYAPDSGTSLVIESRPFRFSLGTATDGTGTPSTVTEDVDDRWEKVPAPGDTAAVIDETKMPVKMTRTTTSPLVFDIDVINWTPRLSGNESSNPIPSLWTDGRKIADMAFHRNRLVLAGDENVVFSQAGDFFNFFLDDHDNIVDADPIDVALSSDEVTLIDHIVPFHKTLLIFTKAGRQFELSTPDTLSPDTVTISPTTSYETTIGVEPASGGNFVYFVSETGNYTRVYEYFYDDVRLDNQASDITAHVPQFIDPDVLSLRTTTNSGRLFVLSNNCDTLWVYQSFWRGNTKEQSAWTKWEFHENYYIHDIAIVEEDLYLLVDDTNAGWLLERLPAGETRDYTTYVCADAPPLPPNPETTGETTGGTTGGPEDTTTGSATGTAYTTGAEESCEFCDGHTPLKVRVTLSGIATCHDCRVVDQPPLGTDAFTLELPANINSSHTLVQSATDRCVWTANLGSAVMTWYRGDLTCTAVYATETSDLYATLTKTSDTNWHLQVEGDVPPATMKAIVFSGDATTPAADCTYTRGPVANTLICQSFLQYFSCENSGGTAIIDPL